MYTNKQVAEKTGKSLTTIALWATKLADTDMVTDGKFFSDDFCTFVAARKPGRPAYLPEPDRIAELFRLWWEHEGDVDAIAGEKDRGIVEIELREIGLIK